MRKYNVAVVGATGVVGRKMMEVLEQRKVAVENLYPMASARSAGGTVNCFGREWVIEELSENSFNKPIDFALFSAGGAISKIYAPIAAAHNVVVIDNSSQWRMDENVPLVVPEVNAKKALKHQGIIANPNCSTIQAVVALKPLYDKYGIRRIVYSTYQSVSGAGRDGIDDLENGLKGIAPKKFPVQIAHNCIPHIDIFLDNGYTKEEQKMIDETRKIIGDPALKITATTVRVPVFYSHSESINVELEKNFAIGDIFDLFERAPGVVLMDDPVHAVYPTALNASGTDDVYVGRIRRDESVESGLNLWVVADNLRKGAATNTVQIAQYLIKNNAFDHE